MTDQVEFTASAERELRALDRDTKQRLTRIIDGLETNPRPSGVRKLRGSQDVYRVRVGPWRVVYRIEDRVLVVVVIRIAHRRDVYRAL